MPFLKDSGTLGGLLAALYFFLLFSRVLDVADMFTPLHIPLVLLTLLAVFSIMSGGLLSAFQSRTVKVELIFVSWICIAFVFSSWHAGGLITLKLVLQSLLLFFCIVVLVKNFKVWLSCAKALALGGVVSSLLSFVSTRTLQGGRISVGAGTLGDPNEYSEILLMTIPFLWVAVKCSRRPRLTAVAAMLGGAAVAVAFLRAGSRGGLVTAGSVLLILLWRARPMQKLQLLALTLIVAVGAFLLLPQYLRERFLTVFSSNSDLSANSDLSTAPAETAETLKADVESFSARKVLLWTSLERTIENPIFGVGPGAFEAVNWTAELKRGNRVVAWQPAHNTYTQISAELGIPGLVLFLAAFACAFRALQRILRSTSGQPPLQQLHSAAQALFMTMTTFCIGACFLSMAYTPMITAMLGLAVALEFIVAKQLAPPHTTPVTPGARLGAPSLAPSVNWMRS